MRNGVRFMDSKFELMRFTVADATDFNKEGTAAILMKDNTMRYINPSGKVILPVEYDKVGNFNEGYAWVSSNGKYGYINTQGEWAIAPQFSNARSFSDGLAAVCDGELWGYISANPDKGANGPCRSVSVDELFGEWSATTYVTGGNIQTADFVSMRFGL